MSGALGGSRWVPHLDYINLTVERFFEIKDETTEIENRPARLQFDEEVNIAIGARVPASH
jgi:hypothetical protein